jgi:hypothetical protein
MVHKYIINFIIYVFVLILFNFLDDMTLSNNQMSAENVDDDSYAYLENVTVCALPSHQRCCCHTFNLLASKDSLKAQSNPAFQKIYHCTFDKCRKLWNLVSRSSEAHETYTSILGKSPTYPSCTRWNSEYDCLIDLLKKKEKLNSVMIQLELLSFKENEFEFLEEYVQCMKPIAEAIDRLQSSKNCYYGELIPQLMRTRKLIESMLLRQLKYCTPLVTVLQNGFILVLVIICC